MAITRTLITMVAISNTTNESETIQIILPTNDRAQLDALVGLYCSEKQITLFALPPQYQNWPNMSSGEFTCEVCNQLCLQQFLNEDFSPQATERFCSNFCRNSVNNDSVET